MASELSTSNLSQAPVYRHTSGVFFIIGAISIFLSLWTNPMAFGQRIEWLAPHYALFALGLVILFATTRINKLQRYISELESKAAGE